MIFTASVEEYADLILNHLDPNNTIISKRFYRKDTVLINNEYTVKDLLKIDRDLNAAINLKNAEDDVIIESIGWVTSEFNACGQ